MGIVAYVDSSLGVVGNVWTHFSLMPLVPWKGMNSLSHVEERSQGKSRDLGAVSPRQCVTRCGQGDYQIPDPVHHPQSVEKKEGWECGMLAPTLGLEPEDGSFNSNSVFYKLFSLNLRCT